MQLDDTETERMGPTEATGGKNLYARIAGPPPMERPTTEAHFEVIERENDHYRPLHDKNLIRRIKQRLARVEGGKVSPEFSFLTLGETRELFKLLGL